MSKRIQNSVLKKFKQFRFLIAVIAVLGLAISIALFQESQHKEPYTTYSKNDLGFVFQYPSNWVVDPLPIPFYFQSISDGKYFSFRINQGSYSGLKEVSEHNAIFNGHRVKFKVYDFEVNGRTDVLPNRAAILEGNTELLEIPHVPVYTLFLSFDKTKEKEAIVYFKNILKTFDEKPIELKTVKFEDQELGISFEYPNTLSIMDESSTSGRGKIRHIKLRSKLGFYDVAELVLTNQSYPEGSFYYSGPSIANEDFYPGPGFGPTAHDEYRDNVSSYFREEFLVNNSDKGVGAIQLYRGGIGSSVNQTIVMPFNKAGYNNITINGPVLPYSFDGLEKKIHEDSDNKYYLETYNNWLNTLNIEQL